MERPSVKGAETDGRSLGQGGGGDWGKISSGTNNMELRVATQKHAPLLPRHPEVAGTTGSGSGRVATNPLFKLA